MNGLKGFIQQKLLEGVHCEGNIVRWQPPSNLEWAAIRSRSLMCLRAKLATGQEVCSQLYSWMTCQSFAEEILRKK